MCNFNNKRELYFELQSYMYCINKKYNFDINQLLKYYGNKKKIIYR